MDKRKTDRETRVNERWDRKHEQVAHDKRLQERRQAAFCYRQCRDAMSGGKYGGFSDAVFWARHLAYHLDALEEEAVHDMRRR